MYIVSFENFFKAKMGFQQGRGLGKYEQGRVEIVEMSKQKGRRGLGLSLGGFEASEMEWDFEKDVVRAKYQILFYFVCIFYNKYDLKSADKYLSMKSFLLHSKLLYTNLQYILLGYM